MERRLWLPDTSSGHFLSNKIEEIENMLSACEQGLPFVRRTLHCLGVGGKVYLYRETPIHEEFWFGERTLLPLLVLEQEGWSFAISAVSLCYINPDEYYSRDFIYYPHPRLVPLCEFHMTLVYYEEGKAYLGYPPPHIPVSQPEVLVKEVFPAAAAAVTAAKERGADPSSKHPDPESPVKVFDIVVKVGGGVTLSYGYRWKGIYRAEPIEVKLGERIATKGELAERLEGVEARLAVHLLSL